MRILLANTHYASSVVGGGQVSVEYLAESLARLGHHVVVVTTTRSKDARVSELNGVRVYWVGLANVYWPTETEVRSKLAKAAWHTLDTYNWIMGRRFGSILDRERPDVVHTNVLSGLSIAAWYETKKRGVPLVHTLRDYYLLCIRSSMTRGGDNCVSRCKQCSLFSLHKKRASATVDAVVGVSQFILDLHLQHGYFTAARKRRVIHNPYSYPSGATGRRKVNEGEDGPLRIGFLGRVHPSKGIEHLLAAVRQFPRHRYHVLVAGRGTPEYERRLSDVYPEVNVSYLGVVERDQFLAEVDILVVPSLWNEPLARTVIEAYANGVPVVGSSRGGLPEIIEEGRTGFVFDPGSPGSLERVLQRCLDSPALLREMRAQALRKAEEFLPSRISAAYLEVYEKVAAG